MFWVANAQSTALQYPASMAAAAVAIMPMAVAPPMSIVELKVGSSPSSAATRAAHPCCSPITAGIITSTPSSACLSMPQSSIARFEASRVKPMALVPGTLPKRLTPTPATAWRPWITCSPTPSRQRGQPPLILSQSKDQHLFHLAALQLHRTRKRKAVDEEDLPRAFVGRDVLARPVEDLLGRGAGARLQNHGCDGALSLHLVRHADDGDPLDCGVRHHLGLDLGREHAVAADLDHLLLARGEAGVAVLAFARQVAGVEPAAAEDVLGHRRIVPVALHETRRAHHELADLAVGDGPHLVVPYLEADPGDRLAD